MEVYMAEIVGTALLVLLGDGTVANAVLNKTKGNNGGWITITTGWAFAVMIPALVFAAISGAHFNPALTIALAATGMFDVALVPGYVICQLIGGFIGACLVYVFYKDHFDATDDKDGKLAVFCTGPAIRNLPLNFICEVIATFVLVFTILGIDNSQLGNFKPFGVGGIISVCGIALGGTTGYAMNPARDFAPRLAHFLLPIKNKRDADWSYAWVPILGPLCGALLGAILANLMF